MTISDEMNAHRPLIHSSGRVPQDY